MLRRALRFRIAQRHPFCGAPQHFFHSNSAHGAHQAVEASSPTTASIAQVVDAAADLLPHQGILENFIHHNPLEHLQNMHFQEALDHVQHLEAYMSPGERVFSLVRVDPRKRVNEALVDLSSAFLDRGAAKWAPRYRDKGLLYFFAVHENLGFALWRKHARGKAKRILKLLNKGMDPKELCEKIIQENLAFFGVPREEWEAAIRSMLLELRGWAGMFRRVETHPLEAPSHTEVHLLEFCAVQSILSRSSIEKLAEESGWNDAEMPFSAWISSAPTMREESHETQAHVSAIAYVDQSSERRDQLETEFKHTLLHAIGTRPVPMRPETEGRPSLQLFTCIDDREGSFRRHVEQHNPKKVETFGLAGFFGIPIRYQPMDGRDQMVLAPEGQDPKSVMVEADADPAKTALYRSRRKLLARASQMWENASFSPIGSLALSALFPVSMARLLIVGLSPKLKLAIDQRIQERFLSKPRTDFALPCPPEQAAVLLARSFKDIGIHHNFAPIIVVLGHGAVSVNNPFAAAYNCGACGGREGGPNARLLARMANDTDVRNYLWKDHNIRIPDDTVFVGGNHNTTTDTVEFFDVDKLSELHLKHFETAKNIIEEARGKNALERCHRFLLAKDVNTPEEALHHVQVRASDLAEVRPELNHATNAAVVIGRRDLTKGHFLDRRVFLPSYDPFSDDDIGTNLEHVMAPALIVCSGINLEYLFSTIDMEHHGAGTKAPLNVVGNIGVLQGTSGDLRPGLPSQMTEMHTPVRALFVVDAPITRVEAVLARRKELRELVRNEWVRFFVRDPTTNLFYRQVKGEYFPIDPKDVDDFVPFKHHRSHGMSVAKKEAIVFWSAASAMVAGLVVPVFMYGSQTLNPYGSLIALSGTMLSLPVLAFSRRYLHGEFMFARFAGLCAALSVGFNIVATAPTLEHIMAGWDLFGFASTFLIGAYNDRPTVRNNATFAFAAYRVSDFALLTASAYAHLHGASLEPNAIVAGSLLLAAIFKSSQIPLTSLFVRSMEGPTPASALGYAGLSAHVGIVLLSSTMPLWYCFDWARLTLGSLGLATAAYGTLVSKTRADRKGAIANATSATLGMIFVTIAMGYPNVALLMSLGHASFRMMQILRAPNVITDSQNLKSGLGKMPWPRMVPDWLYKLSWRLRRVDSDFHMIHLLHRLSRYITMPKNWKLTKVQQWLLTGVGVVLAGFPFTPFNKFTEHILTELVVDHPVLAGLAMAGYYAACVIIIRFLFMNVLSMKRFKKAHVHPRLK